MGENNVESTLYIKSDCEWQPIGPLKTGEPISTSGLFVDGDNAEEIVCIGNPMEFSFSPEMIPCPSRKRFVKLLMAVGVSRNRANEMAEIVVSRKENYRTGLFWCRLMAVIFNAEKGDLIGNYPSND